MNTVNLKVIKDNQVYQAPAFLVSLSPEAYFKDTHESINSSKKNILNYHSKNVKKALAKVLKIAEKNSIQWIKVQGSKAQLDIPNNALAEFRFKITMLMLQEIDFSFGYKNSYGINHTLHVRNKINSGKN
jgi:hypothetical protein